MPRIAQANQQAQAAVGEMGAVLERVLGAFRTVKTSSAEEREVATVDEAAHQAYRRGVSVAGWTALAGVSAFLAIQLSFLVVLGVGGGRVASGELPVSSPARPRCSPCSSGLRAGGGHRGRRPAGRV